MALTAPFEAGRKPGERVDYPVGAGQTIWKGSMLVTRGDGYAYPLRAPASGQPDVFIGFADESVNNVAGGQPPFYPVVTGAAGALNIETMKTGTYLVNMASASIDDVGSLVYGVDDATVSTTSTNAVAVGYITEVINDAQVRIRIDRCVQ
jgi:hypothetical protein